jgi:hypothetical protein
VYPAIQKVTNEMPDQIEETCPSVKMVVVDGIVMGSTVSSNLNNTIIAVCKKVGHTCLFEKST